tara:strand:+ start:18618 stop:19718 length:1101 start_codon:yes stop_codon:yes gene_type:complete
MYIIGKTGTGKTTLLENIALQDIKNGNGLTLIDYHGDLVERIVTHIPEHRCGDVDYFNVTKDTPYGYNPLKPVPAQYRALAASGLLEIFRMHWGERAWGQRMEHILRQAILALLEQPREMTLPDILRLLREEEFRKDVAAKVGHTAVQDFWLHEYPKYSSSYRADAISPVQSKISAFLANPKLYTILTKPQKPLSFRKIMDGGRILLVNLSVGQLGADSAGLLGGLLTTSIGLAALSRADIPEEERRPHALIADEFQHMTSKSLINLFPQLRKYKLSMIVAHQYIHQISEDIRHAILGNVGTIISFRVGAHDARVLAKEFEPTFTAQDLTKLPNYSIYLKLMIDGAPSKPYSADTLLSLNRKYLLS